LLLYRNTGQRAGECVCCNGAVVEGASPVSLEGESEPARGEGSLVAEALDKGGGTERTAVFACVADEAVMGEGRWRSRLGYDSQALAGDAEVGCKLGYNVLVDVAGCLGSLVSPGVED
jgi:hypothetical protein